MDIANTIVRCLRGNGIPLVDTNFRAMEDLTRHMEHRAERSGMNHSAVFNCALDNLVERYVV
jgi:hypothetical protein